MTDCTDYYLDRIRALTAELARTREALAQLMKYLDELGTHPATVASVRRMLGAEAGRR